MRAGVRVVCMVLALGLSAPAVAQSRDETLADIRQELSVLFVQIQRLKRELSTTSAPEVPALGGSALQRIDAIEQELQRLTAKTEELEFRIQRVVQDGTNRIGDLEFRLVELEGGDLGQLGETTTLGGEDMAAAPAPVPAPAPEGGAELAVGERADFDAAKAAFEAGDTARAADLFAGFTQTYPGSPLSGEAHFLRAEALSQQGQSKAAAAAYLESYSGSPEGPQAPRALLGLGLSLDAIGSRYEACQILGQVAVEFPEAPEVQDAAAAMGAIGCN